MTVQPDLRGAEVHARRIGVAVMVLLAVFLVVLWAGQADAQERPRCADGNLPRVDPVTGDFGCADGSIPRVSSPRPTPPGDGNGGGGGGGSSEPPREMVEVHFFVTTEEGSCTRRGMVPVPDGEDAATVRTQYNTRFFLAYDRQADASTHVDPCPADVPETEAVPFITGADVWAVFEGSLDRPEPRIVPGRMLTGLTSYLETGRPLEHTESITVAGMTLDVRAIATFEVDWGDGTVTGPHDTPGEPYPDGTVTHVYTDKGTYDVQVVDTWTMQWRFQGAWWSAPVTTEMAPVPLPDFDVREYRAVRVTPQG